MTAVPVRSQASQASGSRPGTLHVEHCMGTVFTIDIRDDGDWAAAVADIVTWLHQVDATFSTYRPDSVISQLAREELTLAQCVPEVREVLALCEEISHDTGGYFTARPVGALDPSGLVKGWAIERASDLLRSRGSRNHAVNGGGDMQLAGESAPGHPWRVGIAHPLLSGRLAAVVSGYDLAVATSGTAERGAHILDPLAGRVATELASVTVVGERLTTVDAYATAGFAMGSAAPDWLRAQPGYDAMTIGTDGHTWRTPGFPAAPPTSR